MHVTRLCAIPMCVHTYPCAHTHVCSHAYVYVPYLCVPIYMCVRAYVYVSHVCAHLYICVHAIHMHMEAEKSHGLLSATWRTKKAGSIIWS